MLDVLSVMLTDALPAGIDSFRSPQHVEHIGGVAQEPWESAMHINVARPLIVDERHRVMRERVVREGAKPDIPTPFLQLVDERLDFVRSDEQVNICGNPRWAQPMPVQRRALDEQAAGTYALGGLGGQQLREGYRLSVGQRLH